MIIKNYLTLIYAMLISEQLNLISEKKVTAQALCALLVLFIFYIVISSVSSMRIISKAPQHSAPSHLKQHGISKSAIVSSLDLDLFGKYIPKQLGDANIKPSLLDVNVIGVMFSTNKKNSEVMLRFANGIERPFKNGDTIPGGAKIIHISSDGVIVNRDGTLERINLHVNKLKFDKPLKPMQ